MTFSCAMRFFWWRRFGIKANSSLLYEVSLSSCFHHSRKAVGIEYSLQYFNNIDLISFLCSLSSLDPPTQFLLKKYKIATIFLSQRALYVFFLLKVISTKPLSSRINTLVAKPAGFFSLTPKFQGNSTPRIMRINILTSLTWCLGFAREARTEQGSENIKKLNRYQYSKGKEILKRWKSRKSANDSSLARSKGKQIWCHFEFLIYISYRHQTSDDDDVVRGYWKRNRE